MSSTTGDNKMGSILLAKVGTIAGVHSLWILGTSITGLFSTKRKADRLLTALSNLLSKRIPHIDTDMRFHS